LHLGHDILKNLLCELCRSRDATLVVEQVYNAVRSAFVSRGGSARALMNEPELVLADELAENLDYAFSDKYGYLTSCGPTPAAGC